MIPAVFAAAKLPVDIQKVKPTQTITGNQYLKNFL
jgi:hypothetical protein